MPVDGLDTVDVVSQNLQDDRHGLLYAAPELDDVILVVLTDFPILVSFGL